MDNANLILDYISCVGLIVGTLLFLLIVVPTGDPIEDWRLNKALDKLMKLWRKKNG